MLQPHRIQLVRAGQQVVKVHAPEAGGHQARGDEGFAYHHLVSRGVARGFELPLRQHLHQRAVHALRMESIGEVFNSAHPFGQIGRAAQEALKAEVVPVEVAKK